MESNGGTWRQSSYLHVSLALTLIWLLADMKFASSSRMRPRWLVFVMMLPNQDILFVHYKLPTIIMSRRCDQFDKVACLLACPPVCLSVFLAIVCLSSWRLSVCLSASGKHLAFFIAAGCWGLMFFQHLQ